jgi:phage tail protein X
MHKEAVMWKWTLFSTCVVVSIVALLRSTPTKAEDTTVKGEVVDTACFLHYGKKGADHKACAEACLKAGQDMGIYDEAHDTLYVLLENKPGLDPNAPIKNHVAKTVEVTGTVVQRAKVQGIVVKEAKRVE